MAKGGRVPPPPQPPKKEPKNQNKGNVWDRFVKGNPEFAKKWGSLIWKWADVYKIDPTHLAALILAESSGDPKADSGQANGLAQIHLPTWSVPGKIPWHKQGASKADAENPAFAIRFAAWLFSRAVGRTGSYEAAYTEVYNPNDPNRFKAWANIAGTVAKYGPGYVPKDSGLSPADAASVSAETSAEKQALTDPWVVIKKGKVEYVFSLEPPKNVATRAGGMPLTASQWEQAKMAYGSIWYSLTGETNIPPERLVNWVRNGWSPTVVANVVAKNHPKVVGSPLWKAQVPGMVGKARELFGNDWKVDQDLFRKALAEGWDGATLEAKLKARPEYVEGPVFKSIEAAFTYSFQKIYGGKMGLEDKISVREAAAAGWTQAQWEQWLRSGQNYGASAEAQDKSLALLEALGMLTGDTAVLRPGDMPANPNYVPPEKRVGGPGLGLPYGTQTDPEATGAPADDPRIPGRAAQPGKRSNLVAGIR